MGEAKGSRGEQEDFRVKINDGGMGDGEEEIENAKPGKKRKELEEGRGEGTNENRKNMERRTRELEKQLKQVNLTVGEG